MRGKEMDEATKLDIIAGSYNGILRALGIEETDGTKDTPIRAAKALLSLTEGYKMNHKEILSRTFEEKHDEIIIVKDIEVVSLCEHHILPFYGIAHVAYIPEGKVLGLSKMVRLVRCFSKRLQLQERLTAQIADSMMEELKPKGVGVIVEAHHMCMQIRGVKDMNAKTVTSAMRGIFLKSEAGKSPKEEMMRLIYG